MILTKDLAVFDLETTGVDPVTCAIFEYACLIITPEGTRKGVSVRFRPWQPISPEAEEITGVTNEMVADCPPFAEYAERIWKSLRGKDLAGFNINRFDVVCLDQELRRCGLKLDLTGVSVVDAHTIFVKQHPRDLSAAVRTYLNREHDGAHGAQADALATADVLFAQIAAHEDLAAMSIEELATFARHGDTIPVDIAGKLYRDKEGFVRFAFGGKKDARLIDEPGYCKWLLGSDFPGSTRDAVESCLKNKGK